MVCKRVELAPLLCSWIFTSLVVFVSGLNCPEKQYPYTCPSCLSITAEETSEFDSAEESCRNSDGGLVTIEDSSQFQRLGRYLEGFNLSSNRLWVGYRYSGSGNRIDTDGKTASPVLLNQNSFAPGDTHRTDDCIGIQMGLFFSAPCSESLGHVCVHLYEVPRLVSSTGRVEYASPGQTLSLEVEFEGHGISSVEWRQNDLETLPDGVETNTSDDFTTSEIRIASFEPESHSGIYKFLVTNPAGISVLTFWELQQAVLGEITVQPQDVVDLPVGQIAAFECRAESARPEPGITWYKGATPITVSGEGGARINVSELTGTLFIRDIQPSDAGSYHCVASSVAGSVESRQASLSVSAADTIVQSRYLVHPRDVTVLAGQPYSVECVGVQTERPSSSTLFFMGDVLNPATQFEYPSDPGVPFHVKTAVFTVEPSALFCTFGPPPGPGVSNTFSEWGALTVHITPFVAELRTNFGSESSSGFQSVAAGSNPVLSCRFNSSTASEETDVVWNVDGATIEGSKNDEESVLELGQSQPGVHQCMVSNVYGDDISSLVLCKSDGVPGSVSFYAFPDTLTSLYVNWTVPAEPNTHPALLQYRVYYTPVRTNNSVGVADPTPLSSGLFPAYETATVLEGLEEGTRYEVSVVAYSLAGEGQMPTSVAAVTTFSNAPSAPIPSEAVVVTRTADNTVVVITWEHDPPSNTVRYEIEYRDLSQMNHNTVYAEVSDEVQIIQGLVDASNYEVRIRLAVQVRRDPVELAFTPWSEWNAVEGITSLPEVEGVSTEEVPTTQGLLLVIILVPVAVFVIVIILVGILMVVGLWRYKRRAKQSFRPAREESKVDKLRPMGNLVFDLPLSSPVNSAFDSTHARSPHETQPRNGDNGFDHLEKFAPGTISMDVCLSGSQSGSRDDLGAFGMSAAGNTDDELDQGRGALRSWNGSLNHVNATIEIQTQSMDSGLHHTHRDGAMAEIRSASKDSGLADEMPVEGKYKIDNSPLQSDCDTNT